MGVAVFASLLARRVETSGLEAEKERLSKIAAVMTMQLDEYALETLASAAEQQPLPDSRVHDLADQVLLGSFRDVLASYPGTVIGFETAWDRELYVYGPLASRQWSTTSRIHRILAANRALLDEVIDERKALAVTLPGRHGGVLIDARPVEYEGRVIGALFGMSPVGQITAASWRTRRNVGIAIAVMVVIVIIVLIRMLRSLITGVEWLKKGVETLEGDLGFRFAPMGGEFGEVAVAINRMADALQRMRVYEEQASKNQRLLELGRLVAGVAHEIRNPLTSIQGYVQYWAGRPGKPPSPDSIHLVLSETQRLNNLVERLLCFARPATANRTRLDIEDLITEVVAFVTPECTQRNIDIKREASGTARPIEADSEQIRQVILNLIMNAVQAMPTGGVLTVSTCYRRNEMELRVADTGCGIPPQHERDIFSPFFSTKRNGVGLGLAISREIAHAHGGSIDYESEPGKGTTFSVSLPYAHGNRSHDGPDETDRTRKTDETDEDPDS